MKTKNEKRMPKQHRCRDAGAQPSHTATIASALARRNNTTRNRTRRAADLLLEEGAPVAAKVVALGQPNDVGVGAEDLLLQLRPPLVPLEIRGGRVGPLACAGEEDKGGIGGPPNRVIVGQTDGRTVLGEAIRQDVEAAEAKRALRLCGGCSLRRRVCGAGRPQPRQKAPWRRLCTHGRQDPTGQMDTTEIAA